MSNLCGFFCLAFIYFLTISKHRTKNIINDASIFLDLFEDLDLVDDIYKNEFNLFIYDAKPCVFLPSPIIMIWTKSPIIMMLLYFSHAFDIML